MRNRDFSRGNSHKNQFLGFEHCCFRFGPKAMVACEVAEDLSQAHWLTRAHPRLRFVFFLALAQQPQDPKWHTASRALYWSMSPKESQQRKIWCPDSCGLPSPHALAKPGVRNLTKQSGGVWEANPETLRSSRGKQ